MGNIRSARETIINEWEWDEEELSFINSLNDNQCSRLAANMKKASLYNSVFMISKYTIFALFIAVYTLRYFQLSRLALVIQMIIIPVGILAVFSFFMLRRVEANPDYRSLFLNDSKS
ncbi:hypothetical protein [Pedobacter hartonius]|uniref:Uncharacterized protein n=1 Tax=Pedobacter hartonius TaxID=425514 RepID=A0A1H4BN49_9SPHI|nr:hypothetical protein [Pedobacter hartonius]SEA49484.1 hypothetical protein SAMN05443550_103409 [Pedobacter hartonius]